MKKIVGMLAVICLFIAACGMENKAEEANSDTMQQHEGIVIALRDQGEGRQQMLVVSDVQEEDFVGKGEDELIQLAQEKNGAYYSFLTADINVQVGENVIVYWNGTQLESSPPQRGAEKIHIVTP